MIDENLEKLDRWFTHDMLFNLVLPQINFTYIPLNLNHYNNNKIYYNKCFFYLIILVVHFYLNRKNYHL